MNNSIKHNSYRTEYGKKIYLPIDSFPADLNNITEKETNGQIFDNLLVADKGPDIIENITDVDDVTHAYLCRNKR